MKSIARLVSSSISRAIVVSTVCLFAPLSYGQTLNAAYWSWFNFDGTGPTDAQGEGVWADLALASASQSGTTVALGQNTSLCQDNLDLSDAGGITYWCDDRKWVVMNTFEQALVPSGAPSDATFSGCFGNTTNLPENSVRAFVKVFAADFSALYASDFSTSGCWDISIPIVGDVDVQVQRGFEMSGPNNDPRAGAAGTINAYIGATSNPEAGGGSGSGSGGTPEAIPTLPLWGLIGLAGLLGLMGYRRKK